MNNYKNFFKGKPYKDYFWAKKITVMGLGLLGRGLGDVKFLAECGADLIVTDLKSAEDLKTSLHELRDFKNIKFTLGEHKIEDFKNRDFILKAAGVPIDSVYINEARKNNIPIEMSSSLFAKLSGAMIVGITGTRGKSTVTHLIYKILEKHYKNKKESVFLGGNVKGVSTLAFLKKVKEGDIAVLELDSWQLQGFGESHISPHIAVFTTFMNDHLNYYKGDVNEYLNDKANIFRYQQSQDILVVGKTVRSIVHEKYGQSIKGKMIVADPDSVPKFWKIKIPGEHNISNISIAMAVCLSLDVPMETIKSAVESFKGVSGRLEFLKKIKGVSVYNDTTATTPDATIVALRALGDSSSTSLGIKSKKIILIFGGADKNLDMSELAKTIPIFCKAVILLFGTGSDKFIAQNPEVKIDAKGCKNLKEAISLAMKYAKKGDILLFSPAFASFGMFKNEFDRGDQFVEIINSLK